ncbi:MAG: phosphoribosyltransferase [Spirochaetales bacterium]|nr:phosphoribosyltransferase [Spirochaetales bacterium]
MDNKLYVTYNEIHKAVKKLAMKIENSDFDPDVIVAIGSGGFIPARILKTFINRPIFAVGISYYGMDNKPTGFPRKIQWIDEVEKKLTGKKVLLIDEVDDTRATLSYCVRELLNHKPQEIAVLVIHNKKKQKTGEFPPEIKRYYPAVEVDDRWIKYPWDAEDIDEHDVCNIKMKEKI